MKRQSDCQMPGACVLWDFMYISRVFPLFKNMNILKHYILQVRDLNCVMTQAAITEWWELVYKSQN